MPETFGKRGLIFTENHKCHLALTNLKMINDLGFDTLVLPANLTGELQFMDLTLNKTLKQRFSQVWED